jgi:hypothetical protein
MQFKKLALCATAGSLALAVACGKQDSPSPVSPSAAADPGTNAAADGSTLKVTAPTPISPINNQQPEGALVLTATKAAGKFASFPISYEFEVFNASNQRVYTSGVTGGVGAGPDAVSHGVSASLEFDQPYTWRVRGVFQGAVGPWSASASFRAPAGGFIRGNEVFDPLTNGKTVGEIVGPVTFIPGVGVRLEDFSSHIRYRLEQTLVTGEFSIIVTGVATNTEGNKTKIMAMSEGLSDIVTNDRRMTVEKRGDPPGIIAWRFITHDDQIDTEGSAERKFREFDPNKAYLWTATWNGFFNVRIQEGGSAGPTLYTMGKPYGGAYDPNPHYAFIGAPIGRSGPDGATVPGMIVRNVWISPRPRPAGI